MQPSLVALVAVVIVAVAVSWTSSPAPPPQPASVEAVMSRSENAVAVVTVPTKPFGDQKPGTSGLRKTVKTFKLQEHYLENFVQAIFDALPLDQQGRKAATLVLAGDGRYYNKEAIQIILRMAAANGFGRVVVPQHGLMSTPAVSAAIRSLGAYGGIILTASHNPGGVDGDFGVKYNGADSGPAPPKITDAIYECSKKIESFRILQGAGVKDVSLDTVAEHELGGMTVSVVSATAGWIALMKEIFDFDALRRLLARPSFTFVYDSMSGVAGPFARALFVDELGAAPSSLINAEPSEDFNGGHPDPNLTYAKELVRRMGLAAATANKDDDDDNESKDDDNDNIPDFGAAADGDADRNMILGRRFFVNPSDSLAIIAAYASAAIPYFKSGLKGLARSMPTSQAVDRVAAALKIPCHEVPTGWKYFVSHMEAGKCSICGEESFGTSSDHVREKDGLWAVLAWLSILAHRNADASAPFVSVQQIVEEHWRKYGRNYYSRYDYEQVSGDGARALFKRLQDAIAGGEQYKRGTKLGEFVVEKVDEFSYVDPYDGSAVHHQGIRFLFQDGSRFVLRLSGTGSVGATVRLYLEKYESDPAKLTQDPQVALKPLIDVALAESKMQHFIDRTRPTVIT